jgi:anhydro-N-acetylmuramic acid kinase
MIVIGVMSGTSMDGVDAVACQIALNSQFSLPDVRFLAHAKTAYPPRLRRALEQAASDTAHTSHLCELEVDVGTIFGKATTTLLSSSTLPAPPTIIGIHGQTIWHAPRKRATMQIGDPTVTAAMTGLPVWSKFRNADMARGGQGAPLAPVIHLPLFVQQDKQVAVVNIGGIANVTVIPAGAKTLADVTAFDTGPGMVLIDHIARTIQLRGGIDRNGAIARKGNVHLPLLKQLSSHPYFRKKPPKSTGKELFNQSFLAAVGIHPDQYDADLLATVTELTACTIVDAVVANSSSSQTQLILCGGGAYNRYLVERIATLAGNKVETAISDSQGYSATFIEGGLMALMAWYAETGVPLDLSSITGATPGGVIHGVRTGG